MALGGKNSVWKHGTNGTPGTVVDYSTYTMKVSLSAEAEQVESTVFGNTYRDYEQSFKNGKIDVTYKYDAAIYTVLADLYSSGTTVNFELYPDGTASGKPKITGTAFITSFGTPVEIGNLLQLEVSLQCSDTITYTTV